MSKVICDVCGTSFAETVSQCPICGCVRSADAKVIPGSDEEIAMDNGSYTYVKGGRFSKANVNKRNKSHYPAQEAQPTETRQDKRERLAQERNKKSNKGLVIAVLALLLAIVAVVIYIVLRFFAPFSGNEAVSNNDSGYVEQDSSDSTDPVFVEKPCIGITLSSSKVTLDSEGAAVLLNVTLAPVDTTDEAVFTSDDESVATVDAEGKIVAVAVGETIIRITCGDATAECQVICAFDTTVDTTEPSATESSATEAVTAGTELSFNTVYPNEMSLSKGESFKLRLQDANKNAVNATFTSGNKSICTVDDDGTVKAVGTGTVIIRATYEGTTYKCTVHVK